MHFKSALIVCLVYSLTPAWTVGLNSVQLEQLNKLFENHKTSTGKISQEEIAQAVRDIFNIDIEHLVMKFEYKSDVLDSTNLFYLLRPLANTDNKTSDDMQIKKLTAFEVYLFLEEFHKCVERHDQPGHYLALGHFSKSFRYWESINVSLNAKLKEHQNKNDDNYVMNAAEFLLIMLEIKPEVRGLTLEQMEMIDSFYQTHKSAAGGFNPSASEQLLGDLGVTINHELKRRIQSTRSVEILLMKLISVAAKYNNRAVEKNGSRVFSLCQVEFALMEFKEMDVNHDGSLSPEEYTEFAKDIEKWLKANRSEAQRVDNAASYLIKFNDERDVNVAEFVQAVYILDNRLYLCR